MPISFFREIVCNFEGFRKLIYVNGKFEVTGFLDPFVDPKEKDKSLWKPHPEMEAREEVTWPLFVF